MARLVFLMVLGPLLLLSCGGSTAEPTPTQDFLQTRADDTPTPQDRLAGRTPTPVTGDTPVVQSMDEARHLVWVYLGQCFSFAPGQLDAHLVQGDWFVRSSSGLPPQTPQARSARRTPTPSPAPGSLPDYGLWKVDADTGDIEPQDPLARDLKLYVDSQCSPELRPAPFLPTPTSTSLPPPTGTPVAQSMEEARYLLWAHLSRCISFDPSQLKADLVEREWFVRASSESPQEFGIWRVNATTGSLEPHDTLARGWESFVESQCNPEVFATLFTPTPTHSYSLTNTHTHTDTYPHTYGHSHTHGHSRTHAYPHAHAHSHTNTHSHSHTNTHSHTHPFGDESRGRRLYAMGSSGAMLSHHFPQ